MSLRGSEPCVPGCLSLALDPACLCVVLPTEPPQLELDAINRIVTVKKEDVLGKTGVPQVRPHTHTQRGSRAVCCVCCVWPGWPGGGVAHPPLAFMTTSSPHPLSHPPLPRIPAAARDTWHHTPETHQNVQGCLGGRDRTRTQCVAVCCCCVLLLLRAACVVQMAAGGYGFNPNARPTGTGYGFVPAGGVPRTPAHVMQTPMHPSMGGGATPVHPSRVSGCVEGGSGGVGGLSVGVLDQVVGWVGGWSLGWVVGWARVLDLFSCHSGRASRLVGCLASWVVGGVCQQVLLVAAGGGVQHRLQADLHTHTPRHPWA